MYYKLKTDKERVIRTAVGEMTVEPQKYEAKKLKDGRYELSFLGLFSLKTTKIVTEHEFLTNYEPYE